MKLISLFRFETFCWLLNITYLELSLGINTFEFCSIFVLCFTFYFEVSSHIFWFIFELMEYSMYCLQIYAALDIVDHICKSGLDVPIQCFHPILHACEQYGELDMVCFNSPPTPFSLFMLLIC